MTVITGKQFFKSTLNILKTPKPIIKGLWNLQQANPERFMSIGLLLEQQAVNNSDLIAIQFKNQRYSYEGLNQQVNQYAHFLDEYGICKNDKIAIMLDNRPETIIVALAVVKLGAIACMINTTQRNAILEHSLAVVDTKLLIADEIYISAIDNIKTQLSATLQQNIFYIPALKKAITALEFRDISTLLSNYSVLNPDSTAKIQLKHSAFYIFTSGTTGLPKAARMSHHRWFKSMAGMGMASLRLTADDILYLSLPLYHNNALTVSLSAVFGNAATLALSEKFSSSRFWDEIREHKATAFTYIGELCRYLLNVPEKITINNITLKRSLVMVYALRFGMNSSSDLALNTSMNSTEQVNVTLYSPMPLIYLIQPVLPHLLLPLSNMISIMTNLFIIAKGKCSKSKPVRSVCF
ncbi:MAG: acyl-CoA synthetase (AMP-forming)/AMP-acid ligase II [Moritella dasanensis]|jgi:acyl-CoA synthetase (AMP-forming)/AMP-acid ligase II